MSERRRNITTASKVVAGLLLLALIMYLVDPQKSWESIRGANYWYCAAALGCMVLLRFIEAARLYVLIHRFDFTFWELVSVSFVTSFVNNFAPTSVLGEGYRAYYVRNRLTSWHEAIGYILIDKFVGLAVVVVAFFASVMRPGETHPFVRSVAVSTDFFARHQGLLAGIILLILAAAAYAAKTHRLNRVIDTARSFVSSSRGVVTNMGIASFLVLVLLSVGGFLVSAQTLVLLVVGFGAEVSFNDIVALVALNYLSSYVPLTFGGLGIREGIIVFCLALLGIDRHVGMGVALTARVLTLLIAGVGGVLLLRTGKQRSVPG